MTNTTTISIDTLTAKGRETLESERKLAERKAAAKAAVAAYIDGKAALDVLKNPVVEYTYGGEIYTAYANAVDILDNTEKRHTIADAKKAAAKKAAKAAEKAKEKELNAKRDAKAAAKSNAAA